MKATLKKIESVKQMIADYTEMEKADRDMLDGIWVDRKEGTYNCLRHFEWCKHNDELNSKEKKVHKAIKSLCKELGFECLKNLEYTSNWIEVVDAIENQYDKAIKAFYDLNWSCELKRAN